MNTLLFVTIGLVIVAGYFNAFVWETSRKEVNKFSHFAKAGFFLILTNGLAILSIAAAIVDKQYFLAVLGVIDIIGFTFTFVVLAGLVRITSITESDLIKLN